jgi:very-long-chain (3R)-3-hydroxyacyl-CoA dehydratase
MSFFQEGALWDTVGPQVTFWQNLAVLEIVHAALNLTPSSPVMTAIQVYSRVALVGVLNEFPETFATNPWPIRAMLVAWTLAEVTRYVYYCFAKFGEIQTSVKAAMIAMKKARGNELGEPKGSFKIPYPIVWLRYSLFLVLYPLGVSGEIGCLFHALKDIQAMGAAKQASAIGAFCLDYTLRLQSLTPWVACMFILGFYAWILPGLYNMMRAARAKVLGGAAKKAPVSAAKKNL